MNKKGQPITRKDAVSVDGMKRINVWGILGLLVVTLGVYGVVWLFLRRKEIVQKYNRPLPHLWWPLGLVVATLVLAVAIAILAPDTQQIDTLVTMLALIGTVLFGAALATSIWWTWAFSKAVEYVTEGRVPKGWGFVLIMITPFCAVAIQPFFNMARKPSAIAKLTKKNKPSKKFIVQAIVYILIGLAINVVSWIIWPPTMSATGTEADADMPKAQTTKAVRDYFVKVAIGDDRSFSPNLAVQKWEKPEVLIKVNGKMPESSKPCLLQAVADINKHSKEAQLKFISSGEPDISIYFDSRSEFKKIDPTYEDPNWAWSTWNTDGISWGTDVATLLVDNTDSIDDSYRCYSILALLGHSIGLVGKTYDYPESVFYLGDSTLPTEFADIDLQLIGLLYGGYGIKAGNVESTVLDRIDAVEPVELVKL